MRSVIAVSAGLSDESTTKVLAERILAEVAKLDGDIEVELITLRDLAHDITDSTLTRFASKPLQSVYDKLAKADGIEHLPHFFRRETQRDLGGTDVRRFLDHLSHGQCAVRMGIGDGRRANG